MNLTKKLPIRIIKTVIAIYLAYFSAALFRADPFFAVLGSLRSMKSSLTLSIKELFEQFVANLIGFTFAIIYTSLLGVSPLSVSLAILSLFLTIKHFKLGDNYLPAGFVTIALMMLSSDEHDLIIRSILRLYSTTFGMVIALLINIVLFRPKNHAYINRLIINTNKLIKEYPTSINKDFNKKIIDKNTTILNDYLLHLNDELQFKYLLVSKRSKINKMINEINLIEIKKNIVYQLVDLKDNLIESIIPIYLQLEELEYHPHDKQEQIIDIKARLKTIYYNDTSSDDFYTNTTFLASLSKYINIIRTQ